MGRGGADRIATEWRMGWLRVPCWLRRPQREREANGGVSCGRSGIDDHPPEPCILRAGRLEGVGGADEPWVAVAKDPASLLESKTLRGDTFTFVLAILFVSNS